MTTEDPDNLEGPPPSDEERAALWKELDRLHIGNRFRLMFGMPLLPGTSDTDDEP